MRPRPPAVLTAALVSLLVLAGCAADPAPDGSADPGATAPTTEATDFPRTVEVPAGRELAAASVTLDDEPQRIAALTYETAELVAELGATDRLVMVQDAMSNPVLSDHADAMAAVEHHAPTEGAIDAEQVIAAAPDLVLLSDRRGLEEGIGQVLEGAGIPVLVLPNNWASVADMELNIGLVGQALGLDDDAAALAEEIGSGLGDASDPDGPRVLVLSNQAGQPFVTAGSAFPLEVLRLAGAQDASADLGLVRSGPITAEQVLAAEPDAILLVDMNGSGEQIFTPLLTNDAVAGLPAVAEDRVLLVEGRDVQALGFTSTVEGRAQIAEWLATK
ncbi:ABC transporter substrate-binding protein [Georgenia sp. MJ170]|uniref:ABC transporter substrate-binding protein n=1 Tax=Georgenia sunbinii TaxID=3117728 RepID=UPI002F266EA1